jgi:hypothetical protein
VGALGTFLGYSYTYISNRNARDNASARARDARVDAIVDQAAINNPDYHARIFSTPLVARPKRGGEGPGSPRAFTVDPVSAYERAFGVSVAPTASTPQSFSDLIGDFSSIGVTALTPIKKRKKRKKRKRKVRR